VIAMPIFGPNEQQLKEIAKRDYDKAVALKGDSRKEDAYRMRIGLRARGHIDKLFVEAAQKAEKFNDIAMIHIAQGKPAPEPPKPPNFMKLMTASGEVWSYIPEEYSVLVFKYGMLYQSMNVSGPKAIFNVQRIIDSISNELKLPNQLMALEFLRTQLAEEGMDVDAEIIALEPDDGADLEEV
tara:strand:+ start:454 stop:1002 length:549 start_codon:yes stop_codon:yes gene_type:complete